jgi:hypothetical protein
MVNALACIGTAVTLFPVVKRKYEATALGFVAARLLEAAIILIGVMSLSAVVTLRQDLADATGANAEALVTTGRSLVIVRNWTFLLGPGLMPGINALLLGSLMYSSRLVPRVIPTLGLVGGPLLIAGTVAAFFGYTDQVSVWSAIGTLPVAAWSSRSRCGWSSRASTRRRPSSAPRPARSTQGTLRRLLPEKVAPQPRLSPSAGRDRMRSAWRRRSSRAWEAGAWRFSSG